MHQQHSEHNEVQNICSKKNVQIMQKPRYGPHHSVALKVKYQNQILVEVLKQTVNMYNSVSGRGRYVTDISHWIRVKHAYRNLPPFFFLRVA